MARELFLITDKRGEENLAGLAGIVVAKSEEDILATLKFVTLVGRSRLQVQLSASPDEDIAVVIANFLDSHKPL